MVGLLEGCYIWLLWLVCQRLLKWVVVVGLSEGCYCGLLWLVCQRVVIVGCYGWFVIVGCYSGLLWLVC